MATSFLYVDFLKSIDDLEFYNPTTIVEYGEDLGLLQQRFECLREEQEERTQGDENAKKVWSEGMATDIFPEEQLITLDDVRKRANGAIRALRHRKSCFFPKVPDGFASNNQKGWHGYRWKQMIPRQYWSYEEWKAFQARVKTLEERSGQSGSDTEDEQTPEPVPLTGETEEQSAENQKSKIFVTPCRLWLSVATLLVVFGLFFMVPFKTDERSDISDKKSAQENTVPLSSQMSFGDALKATANEKRIIPDPDPAHWEDFVAGWNGRPYAPTQKNDHPKLFLNEPLILTHLL